MAISWTSSEIGSRFILSSQIVRRVPYSASRECFSSLTSTPKLSLDGKLGKLSPKLSLGRSMTRSASSGYEKQSLYKRILPPTTTAFSSPEGKAIYKEALLDGTMEVCFICIF